MNLKKILLPIATLALIMILGGCIIVIEPKATHSFTITNTTDTDIYDWFLDSKDGHRYSINGKEANNLNSTESSTMTNLYEDYYIVYFSYKTDKDQYLYSPSDERGKKAYFYLGSDKEFLVYENKIKSRAANDENYVPELYIIDSDGNRFELSLAE